MASEDAMHLWELIQNHSDCKIEDKDLFNKVLKEVCGNILLPKAKNNHYYFCFNCWCFFAYQRIDAHKKHDFWTIRKFYEKMQKGFDKFYGKKCKQYQTKTTRFYCIPYLDSGFSNKKPLEKLGLFSFDSYIKHSDRQLW